MSSGANTSERIVELTPAEGKIKGQGLIAGHLRLENCMRAKRSCKWATGERGTNSSATASSDGVSFSVGSDAGVQPYTARRKAPLWNQSCSNELT